jgi:hypothetical protein
MTKPVVTVTTLVTEDGVPIDAIHLPGPKDLAPPAIPPLNGLPSDAARRVCQMCRVCCESTASSHTLMVSAM